MDKPRNRKSQQVNFACKKAAQRKASPAGAGIGYDFGWRASSASRVHVVLGRAMWTIISHYNDTISIPIFFFAIRAKLKMQMPVAIFF